MGIAITSLIREKKGDYIIALKPNQKYLHQEIKEWLERAKAEGFKEREYSHYQSIETGHQLNSYYNYFRYYCLE